MFFRILGESFGREPRRKMLAAAALILGMTVTTATLSVVLDVGDRLAREFRSLGANLLVLPKADTLPLEIGGVDHRPVEEGAYLPEDQLGKLKTIFWRLNIVGFAPFLEVPVEAQAEDAGGKGTESTLIGTWFERAVPIPDGTTFLTGAASTHPWWRVEGRWFRDDAEECLVGAALARRAGLHIGDGLVLRTGAGAQGMAPPAVSVRVTGLVVTGGAEEEAVLAPLWLAQRLANRPGEFRRLLVSALTKPEDEFARRDPSAMTPTEYDRWYCTPYISSIAHQIQEILPGTEVRVLRRVAEGEGRILGRVSGVMWLVTLAALVAAALAVGATAASTVLERRAEVALMKALGAGNGSVAALFLAEQLLLAIVGGAAGYAFGTGLARWLGRSVFGVPPTGRMILLPLILVLAALVALAGSLLPLRRAARFRPAAILRGE